MAQAAEVLDISSDEETLENLEKETVKQKFRENVKEDHPDQGGSREEFDKDRKAKDKLLNFVGSEYQDEYSKLKTTRSKKRNRNRNRNRTRSKNTKSNQADSRNNSTSNTSTTDETSKNTSQDTTHKSSTKNQTEEDWYDKSQRNTTKTTEPTAEEEFTKDDSFFYNSFVTLLTYFNLALLHLNKKLRTQYILFIGSGVMSVKLLGDYFQSDSVLLTLPGIESITPEIAQVFLFVAPILIYTDMRAQKMRANYILSQVLQTDIMNLDEENPIQYNIITKLLLLGGSFGYTGMYLAQVTQYSYLLIVIVQLSIVLIYSILRKTPPTKSQISKEYR